jgi:hypothetical protein
MKRQNVLAGLTDECLRLDSMGAGLECHDGAARGRFVQYGHTCTGTEDGPRTVLVAT